MKKLIKKYTLSNGITLELTDRAINHIVYGDITTKPINTPTGRIGKNVISGGLHTVSGWTDFKKNCNGLKHLVYYNSDVDTEWFYARELQNEVILLKLPIGLLTSKAAKMTRSPEINYKSGYLWKTLFPKSIGFDDIPNVIDEVVKNLNYKESRDGELIGYINISDPLKTMRVSILYRNGEINSAFPTWTQPNTGNNGKPFSYFDNIGHVISGSTVFFEDDQSIDAFKSSMFSENPEIEDIHRITPTIFLKRTFPTDDLDSWRSQRRSILKKHAEALSASEVEDIYRYITDFVICKLSFQLGYGYVNKYGVPDNPEIVNALLYAQNIIDGLFIIYFCNESEEKFPVLIKYLLENMVTYGYIDSWNKRRIHLAILELCWMTHDPEIMKSYVEHFSKSPTRRELFIEYDCESLMKRNAFVTDMLPWNIPHEFAIIKSPPSNSPITMEDFLNFARDNLGESYAFCLNERGRNIFLSSYMKDDNITPITELNLKHISQMDFYNFSFYFGIFVDKYIELIPDVQESFFIDITRDYFKMQVAQRHRTNLNYKEYAHIVPLPHPPIGKDFLYAVILKHERISNFTRTEDFIKKIGDLAEALENEKLKDMVKTYLGLIGKEKPQLPININGIMRDLEIENHQQYI